MLRAEPAEFFCFYPSLLTFWGTLVANDGKIVHFTFYVYFPGALGPRTMFFESHDGATPRHCAERSGPEN